MVLLEEEESRRVDTESMSRVKPAKMLKLRELPITSDKMRLCCGGGGGVVEPSSEGGSWMPGVLVSDWSMMGTCCGKEWRWADEKTVSARRDDAILYVRIFGVKT